MSGGSMNYIYCKVEEAADLAGDKEISALLRDLAKVLKSEEWWCSGDSGEERYVQDLKDFKNKWLNGGEKERNKRLKEYVDEELDAVKRNLYILIGIDPDGGNDGNS